jgi:DNA processing protein
VDPLTQRHAAGHDAAGVARPVVAERMALLRLVLTPGVGPARLRDGIRQAGSAGDLLDCAGLLRGLGIQPSMIADEAQAAQVLADCARLDVRCLGWHEDDYPSTLLELEQAPAILFVRGDARVVRGPAIAIVGSRKATVYGRRIAQRWAQELSEAGVVVVSGLALGIDGAAHTGALAGSTPTVGVVAGAIERPSPRAHAYLYRQMLQQGGAVFCEYPPGTQVQGFQFPVRNRLMAGLSMGVLVVEAGPRSGALHTVDWAQKLGRPVLVVPGPIDRDSSRGTNDLLRQGAEPALEVRDVLDAIGVGSLAWTGVGAQAGAGLPWAVESDEAQVWQALSEPGELGALASLTGLPVPRVLAALTRLEIDRRVRRDADQGYRRSQ